MKRIVSLLCVLALLGTFGIQRGLRAASSGHAVTLTWTASSSATGCTSPCTFGYNILRGTTAGGESATPLNSSPVIGLTFTDSTVTLGSNPISYFYVVQAVETSSGVTVNSASSNEVSVTFPGLPAAPVLGSPTAQ